MTMDVVTSKESQAKAIKARLSGNHLICDAWIALSALSLVLIGFVMVASSSIGISEQNFHQPFYYLFKQMVYLVFGVFCASFVIHIELQTLRKYAWLLLIAAYLLLSLVLIPGIGKEVNGSFRWIGVGLFGIQVSEIAKLFIIIYLADYLARREQQIRTQVIGFIKPMVLLTLVTILLLKEPDFGAAGVIITTSLVMMFLAGVRLWPFMVLTGVVAVGLAGLAISSPYRMARLTSFLNPWAAQFDSGYQLTQSLIAFGRGGFSGVGLGESVQKLFYLPEAHTDFLFAVIAEELGLIGALCVLAFYLVLVGRSLWIGSELQQKRVYSYQSRMPAATMQKDSKNEFSAYLVYGLAIWIGLQALINVGVSLGILPTKGLTLPFMSYGGSSLVIMCVVVALILRIDYERRLVVDGRNVYNVERRA